MTSSTKDRILEIAEAHFADHGYAGASMRKIMAEAGVDTGAVHYHFGSKKRLFQAVVGRWLEPLNATRLERLDKLEAGSEPPSLEALIDAFMAPSFELARRPGGQWGRFVGWFRVETGDHWGDYKAAYGHLPKRFLTALARALPDLDRQQVAFRFLLLIALGAGFMTDHRTPDALGLDPTDQDSAYQAFLLFAAAGMRAAPTSS